MTFEWSTVFMSLAVFFALMAAGLVVLNSLADRFSDRLAPFCYNDVAGVFVVCAKRDYEKGQRIGRWRVVPESVVMSETPHGCPRPGRWVRYGSYLVDSSRGNLILCSDLFIPFLNETNLTFEQQEEIFGKDNKFPKASAFFDKKKDEAMGPIRLAIVRLIDRLERRHSVPELVLSGFVAAFVFLLFTAFAIVYKDDVQRGNEESVFYTTTPGAGGEVRGHHLTRSQLANLPLGDTIDREVQVGQVTQIMGAGGGLVTACVRLESGRQVCALAAETLGLKPDQRAFIRFATLRQFDISDDMGTSSYCRWFISKEEASALKERGHYIFKR